MERLSRRSSAPSAAEIDPELAAHLASCPGCRIAEVKLGAALDAWRTQTAAVASPNPATEWQAVKRRLREPAGASAPHAVWRRLLLWSAPLTVAAALAFVVSRPASVSIPLNEPALGLAPHDEDASTTSLNRSMASAKATEPDSPPGTAAEGGDNPWDEFHQHFAFTARAEFVETDDEDASPFVFVDDESGWLIVWASAPADPHSI